MHTIDIVYLYKWWHLITHWNWMIDGKHLTIPCDLKDILSPQLHKVVCITSSSIGWSMQLNRTCDLKRCWIWSHGRSLDRWKCVLWGARHACYSCYPMSFHFRCLNCRKQCLEPSVWRVYGQLFGDFFFDSGLGGFSFYFPLFCIGFSLIFFIFSCFFK